MANGIRSTIFQWKHSKQGASIHLARHSQEVQMNKQNNQAAVAAQPTWASSVNNNKKLNLSDNFLTP